MDVDVRGTLRAVGENLDRAEKGPTEIRLGQLNDAVRGLLGVVTLLAEHASIPTDLPED